MMDERMDEIRPADKPIRECLLPPISGSHDLYESEEDQLIRILEESRETFEEWELSETYFELQHAILLSKTLQEEKEARIKQVASFKSKFIQFMKIDRPNLEFYSQIIQCIEKYESDNLISMNIGEEYYARFRNILDNMRISKEEKSKLVEIFTQ
jgi:hypothetical protein